MKTLAWLAMGSLEQKPLWMQQIASPLCVNLFFFPKSEATGWVVALQYLFSCNWMGPLSPGKVNKCG